jgi:Spy/CpxP family protein refolding chaperone
MKKINSIIIGLAVVILTVSAVYAQTQGESQQRGDGQKGSIFKELNLTSEQQKKLAENRNAQREEMAKLHTAIKEKQTKLQEELKNPAVTRAIVEPLVNEIKSLGAQLIENRINGIFAVKEILTPEQFVKFEQMTEKGHKNKKGYMQNWRNDRKPIKQN